MAADADPPPPTEPNEELAKIEDEARLALPINKFPMLPLTARGRIDTPPPPPTPPLSPCRGMRSPIAIIPMPTPTPLVLRLFAALLGPPMGISPEVPIPPPPPMRSEGRCEVIPSLGLPAACGDGKAPAAFWVWGETGNETVPPPMLADAGRTVPMEGAAGATMPIPRVAAEVAAP